jgi:hypothetical protein
MLKVQEFLQTKTFDDLNAELGIVVKRHDTLPLCIVNYDQIDSPKTHPIVRECRGLVLHADTKAVVAKSFDRFFNWGEVQEEMPLFDFSDFIVQSKEDGSLVVLYWSDDAESWMANTRGSFAVDLMQHSDLTWQQGIMQALGVEHPEHLLGSLNYGYTYICEFCSPWNKVVRRYDKPVMYLLTAFEGTRELTWDEADAEHARLATSYEVPKLLRPTRYDFKTIEDVQVFLHTQAAADPTFEGVVIRDKHGHRWKIKSATYLGLHRLRGEGDNLFAPKNLLPFVMSGEDDELLTYYPEVTEAYLKLKAEVDKEYATLLETWADTKDIADQKTFALAIKDRTVYSSVLFQVRKQHGAAQTVADVKRTWREASSLILKKLKG